MQKDTPQPTAATATASAQLLSPDVDLAHKFLVDCEKDVQNLLCDTEKHTVRTDIPIGDATTLGTVIATGLSAILVPWLATQPGWGVPAAATAAAVTVAFIVAAIIMKIGVASFCRFGTAALKSGS